MMSSDTRISLKVAKTPLRIKHCAEAMGFALIPDTNSPDALCDGMATLESTVNQKRQRVSTLEAYLPRTTALTREKNLTICTRVTVSQIKFSGDDAERRADRVLFQHTNSNSERTYSAKVKREVIVCSGAIGSPQVLMLRFGLTIQYIQLPVPREAQKTNFCLQWYRSPPTPRGTRN